MRYEIGFGIGFDRHGNAIRSDHAVECIKLILVEACQRFGGCNILPGQGAWIDGKGTLIVEESRVLIVDTDARNTSRLAADHLREAKELASYVRGVLDQEAVHFTQIVSVAENQVLTEVRV